LAARMRFIPQRWPFLRLTDRKPLAYPSGVRKTRNSAQGVLRHRGYPEKTAVGLPTGPQDGRCRTPAQRSGALIQRHYPLDACALSARLARNRATAERVPPEREGACSPPPMPGPARFPESRGRRRQP
jgi:hypothetical protein